MIVSIVTGGCGFIGNYICKALIKSGHYVICIDNLSSGNLDNIREIENHQNFQMIRHDVIEPLTINKNVNYIYHLACPASPDKYQEDSLHTLRTSIYGTENMLKLAKEKNAKLLFTSTSEVYGNPLVSPQNENYWGNVNPIGKRSCYDEGKRCAETIIMEYHKKYKIPICIVRLFNTYGPFLNKNDGRVISNFICQALENKNLTVYGDGSQTRSFCYVEDTVNVILLLMEENEIGPFNIGNPNEMTINQIASLIKELTESDSKIHYLSLPEDDPERRRPCIEKIKRFWQPTTDIKEGLLKTIDYFKHL